MAVDPLVLLRRFIMEGLNTERVSTVVLPEYLPDTGEGFNPPDGPWIVIGGRGGIPHAELPLQNPSVQVRIWAGPDEFQTARERYGEVRDLIHQATNRDFDTDGYLYSCLEEVEGQDIVDPDEGYATVLSFYQLHVRAN